MEDKRSASVPTEMGKENSKGVSKSLAKAKSSPFVVKQPESAQNKTQIAVRLNTAVQNSPKRSGRSQDVVPLSRDCERLTNHLREFISTARVYQRSMVDYESNRTNVRPKNIYLNRSRHQFSHSALYFLQLYHKTEALSKDTTFSEVVGSETSDMGRSLEWLQEKFKSGGQKHSNIYQEMIIEYAVEWKSVLARMTDSEMSHAHQLHKTVQHYEEKVNKLRKQVSEKENKNGQSAPLTQKEKLERNEEKLAKAWEEYDAAATRTANLLEEATKMGWKDLHPLVQAMIVFEQERDRDEHDLWDCVGTIQEKLIAMVSMQDDPAHPKEEEEFPPIHELEDDLEEEVDSTAVTEVHMNKSDHDEKQEELKAECDSTEVTEEHVDSSDHDQKQEESKAECDYTEVNEYHVD